MSWSARREAERAPAAAAEVFVHTKPWRTLTELKREAMAQRPWKGAKLRGAAAVAAAPRQHRRISHVAIVAISAPPSTTTTL